MTFGFRVTIKFIVFFRTLVPTGWYMYTETVGFTLHRPDESEKPMKPQFACGDWSGKHRRLLARVAQFALGLALLVWLDPWPIHATIGWIQCSFLTSLLGDRLRLYHWHVRDGGIQLELGAAAVYRFRQRGFCGNCLRTAFNFEHMGRFLQKGTDLQLVPVSPNGIVKSSSLPQEFRSVLWGDKRYLVGPSSMRYFISRANLGLEPCRGGNSHPDFFLRAEDWGRTPNGPLRVPEEFSGLVISQHLNGEISHVAPERLVISLGKQDGLVAGNLLVVNMRTGDAPPSDEVIEVVSVRDGESEAKPEFSSNTKQFVPGLKVSSQHSESSWQRKAYPFTWERGEW